MDHTEQAFDRVVAHCKGLFAHKLQDYGAAWRILRHTSVTDQIFIKAQRIRTLEEKGVSKVGEGIVPEYIGIFNYSAIALIQLELGVVDQPDLTPEQALQHFDRHVAEVKALMLKKNHDYGEAWREMRMASLTDLILQKLLRIKQIEDNQGQTIASEGLSANFQDMMNYSAFALIRLGLTESYKNA
jgi:hypothetical protein